MDFYHADSHERVNTLKVKICDPDDFINLFIIEKVVHSTAKYPDEYRVTILNG